MIILYPKSLYLEAADDRQVAEEAVDGQQATLWSGESHIERFLDKTYQKTRIRTASGAAASGARGSAAVQTEKVQRSASHSKEAREACDTAKDRPNREQTEEEARRPTCELVDGQRRSSVSLWYSRPKVESSTREYPQDRRRRRSRPAAQPARQRGLARPRRPGRGWRPQGGGGRAEWQR